LLLSHQAMRDTMGHAAQHLGMPDAAVAVAHEVQRLYTQAPITGQRGLRARVARR